ncbi:hypothetical protein QN277_003486 [Acacia crassicarpa]|uniref:CCHC-type domain-containing protein n=1 Tax=Acacia crassicarpa TaxID=499986 RepID=A0AAE1JVW9_9FABA|nr:hypothetical protein QN277_003486 [Acacia crassicarpa]
MERNQEGKRRFKSWATLKRLMDKRFLPASHKQGLYLKIYSLKQEDMSVEEYIREYEQLLMTSGLQEIQEQKIARFIGGLNNDIAKKVELQPFWTFEDVCKLPIKVEKRSKSKKSTSTSSSFFKNYSITGDSSSPKNIKEEEKEKVKEAPKEFKKKLDGKKCFKCQGYGHFQADCSNRRVMTLKEIEEIKHEYEQGPVWDAKQDEIPSEEIILGTNQGEHLLMLRRVLHAKEAPKEKGQREQIFYTRCTVKEKVCNLIVDSGSCANVASTLLIQKLQLPTTPHPHPY